MAALHKYSRSLRLMGNTFSFTVVGGQEGWATACVESAIAEVKRIEALLTTFRDDSETARINAAAGQDPVPVTQEVFELIRRAQRISVLTQGAFDLSYGSVDKRFWNFDTQMTTLPDPEIAKASVRLIDYRNILLNEAHQTVFLKEKGMRIGFGGIGKGYAAARAAAILQQSGVENGVVNAAGDLTAWGHTHEGQPWTIGIADPVSKTQLFSKMQISGLAVATSGDYEKYAVINGKPYSHTIDPRTGYPVSGIRSVTIICPNAELADALTTPVLVMGIKAGMNMVNQMRDIACIVVDDNQRIHHTQNIRLS